MKIQINEDYFIEVDRYSHILHEDKHKKDKDNRDITVVHGHFNSVERALVFLARHLVRTGHLNLTLNEYLKELKKVTQELVDAVEGVGGK